mmetsp:Transcript_57961/g.67645  ORF Transcript_57961/g.67645 Transcript_57961/m.67645 type:complete len:219 (+) Transcript_57961:265-921(+)
MQDLSTETNDSGNEKDILALVQTPILAIDLMNMDMPSKMAFVSNYQTARQELATETKNGGNGREIVSLIQIPIPATDPMNVTPRSSIVKRKKNSEEKSSPLHHTLHAPNNELIEDLIVRPGAYHIPGIGANCQEDTNATESSFTATPVAKLVSPQRSIITQTAVSIQSHQTLVNFKDKRVQLVLFSIAVVIISLTFFIRVIAEQRNISRKNYLHWRQC